MLFCSPLLCAHVDVNFFEMSGKKMPETIDVLFQIKHLYM